MGTIDTHGAVCHVLVVDDSELDRRLAGGILRRRQNMRVTYAEHGEAAVRLIESQRPDLVLTDMHMPKLNGLELVEFVRERYPAIPTILMTAHGSEELAVQALQRGAASYVPKRNLAGQLLDTISRVLELARTIRAQRRLNDFWSQTRFEFRLENDTSLIAPLVAHLQEYVTTVQECDDNELLRLGVALHEALRNAIHHGNLELSSELRNGDPNVYYEAAERRRVMPPYRDRTVVVTASESRSESRYCIVDEGPGFDTARTGPASGQPVSLESHSGRGLLLIHTFMDEVHYNSRGNEITMVRRRTPRDAGGNPRECRTSPSGESHSTWN